MQTVVVLLIGAFIVGGTGLGRWLRDRPLVMLIFCTLAASTFYSLRVLE